MKTYGHTHTHTHIHTHIHTHTYTHTHIHTHIHIHIYTYTRTIETYGPQPTNRNIWPSPTRTANQYKHMAQRHIIETYGLAPRTQPTNRNIWPSAYNRNIWPHNSRATAAPSRLADSFVCFGAVSLITTHATKTS